MPRSFYRLAHRYAPRLFVLAVVLGVVEWAIGKLN